MNGGEGGGPRSPRQAVEFWPPDQRPRDRVTRLALLAAAIPRSGAGGENPSARVCPKSSPPRPLGAACRHVHRIRLPLDRLHRRHALHGDARVGADGGSSSRPLKGVGKSIGPGDRPFSHALPSRLPLRKYPRRECREAVTGNCFAKIGGGGEIRTHEGREPLPVFKTGALNRSATPPANSINNLRRAFHLRVRFLHPFCNRTRKKPRNPTGSLPVPDKDLDTRGMLRAVRNRYASRTGAQTYSRGAEKRKPATRAGSIR